MVGLQETDGDVVKGEEMNTGTKLRTILIIATCLNTALMATDVTGFHNAVLDTIYTWMSIILNFIIVALATYFNNDYTPIASKHTGRMRLEKAQQAGLIDGEDFTDEPEPDEDGEDLDEDEANAEDIDDGPDDGDDHE